LYSAGVLVPVHDPDDPRLSDYVALREREQAEVFIAEGLLVVEALLTRGRYPVRSLLVAESKVERLPPVPPEVPIYSAPQAVLDRVVGFPIHRGVLAAGVRPRTWDVAALLAELPPRATLVVGLGLSNHDNVGALFRNAAALGAHAVLLDDQSADPLYRKAIRVSMGHALTLPSCAHVPWTTLAPALATAGFELWATTPGAEAEDLGSLLIRGAAPPPRVAVLVGAEGPGLSVEQLAQATRRVRIPMSAGVDSLNVATAAALVLFVVDAGHRASASGGGVQASATSPVGPGRESE